MAEVHGPRKLKLSRSARCCGERPQPGTSEPLSGARRGSDSTRRVGDEDGTCFRHASTVRSPRRRWNLTSERTFSGQTKEVNTMGRGLLLWLIGIPIPIILLIWLFGGLH